MIVVVVHVAGQIEIEAVAKQLADFGVGSDGIEKLRGGAGHVRDLQM